MDDGTAARLAEDHFVVTTTTANAVGVYRHMEFARQCLWPDMDVQIISTTEAWAQFSVAGPNARKLLQKIRRAGIPGITAGLGQAMAAAGGGSLPAQNIPSAIVSIRCDKMTPARLEAGLRRAPVPVLVRVDENEILIDLRTVTESEFGFITDGLKLVVAS